MSDYCVIVTGGAYARFFTLEPVEFPELESGPRLVECGKIANPEKEIAGRHLYTDSKMGRGLMDMMTIVYSMTKNLIVASLIRCRKRPPPLPRPIKLAT